MPRIARVFRLPRRTLRLQLTLLYAGFFFACGVAVLLVPVLTVKQSIPEGASASTIAQIQANSRGQVIRAAASVAGLVVLSLGVGWWIADRFLRPLRTITATAQDISASSLDRRVPWAAVTTSSPIWGRRSTACSAGSRRRSSRSGGSWPTPRTNCAPRSPRSGP
jgi:hypothetical protein